MIMKLVEFSGSRGLMVELHYDDQPWEKEAYRLEGELYEMFAEEYYDNV